MIVNKSGGKLALIDQTEHADLSAQFAAHWGSDDFCEPEPFLEMILAARFHDEGYRFSDDNPFYDGKVGRPLNFSEQPPEYGLKASEETVNRVSSQPEYARLIISMHRTGLSRRRYYTAGLDGGNDNFVPRPNLADMAAPRFEHFVKREETWQDETQKVLSKSNELGRFSSMDSIWTNYKLLQVWDRLSLYACFTPSRQLPESIFPVPVSYVEKKDARITVEMMGKNTIKVSPWPFKPRNFKVSVETRVVDDKYYTSRSELCSAFYKAPREALIFDYVDG